MKTAFKKIFLKKYTLLTLLIITFFIIPIGLLAQYNINQNKVWVFGYHSGLNFASGSPAPFNTQINGGVGFVAGCASVSDGSGSLLFYCTSDTIWDNLGNVMPHGSGLMPNPTVPGSYYTGYSASQGALIVPVIGTTNQYYVFSLETSQGRLFYCKVDMSLNGGLGDVVTTVKGIQIDSELSQKMIAIPGNSNDIWIVVHALSSGVFSAFHVTGTGLNITPVVSSAGGYSGSGAYEQGPMKCSPDRNTIAVVNLDGPALQLATFDPATGIVSGLSSISAFGGFSGGDFSPDNSKFYVYNKSDNSIDQFNLAAGSPSAIYLSETPIGYDLNIYWSDMRLAPNGKIYVPQDTNQLDYIANPNLLGSACNYTVVPPAYANSVKFGFGNIFVVPITSVSPITGTTSVCVSATSLLSDATTGGTWSSSNAAVASVNSVTGIVSAVSLGTATISYNVGGGTATTIFSVTAPPAAITGTSDVCMGVSSTLGCSPPGGIWTSSSTAIATIGITSGLFTGLTPGTSIITYSLGSSCQTTKIVTVNIPTLISGIPAVCPGATTTLSGSVAGGIWSSSNTTIATVGVTDGFVTGVAPGTSTITYTPSAGCSTDKIVTVNSMPVVGSITGELDACIGVPTLLANATAGGTWSSGNPAIATIGSSSGVLTGISAGDFAITYSIHGCGTVIAVRIETVLPEGFCPTSVSRLITTEGIKLFPNPTKGNFTVSLYSTADEPVHIVVSNVIGEKVNEITSVTNKYTELQLNAPPGIYFVLASTAESNYITKVVVE